MLPGVRVRSGGSEPTPIQAILSEQPICLGYFSRLLVWPASSKLSPSKETAEPAFPELQSLSPSYTSPKSKTPPYFHFPPYASDRVLAYVAIDRYTT